MSEGIPKQESRENQPASFYVGVENQENGVCESASIKSFQNGEEINSYLEEMLLKYTDSTPFIREYSAWNIFKSYLLTLIAHNGWFWARARMCHMKNTKKSSKYEPTISDVLDAVQTGFARNDAVHTTLFQSQKQLRELLDERTGTLNQRVSNLQNRVEDVVDMLDSVSRVTDKHERRIVRLEKVCA